MEAYYKVLCVAAGGFVGSILRYEVSNYLSRKANSSFPYGTVFVNITGSFFLGSIVALNMVLSVNTYLFIFLTTGFAGAFTTFSTAMYEQYKLIEDKENKEAVIYFLYTMAGGIVSVMSGYWIIRFIILKK